MKAHLSKDNTETDANTHIWEGMTVADFWTTLEQFFSGFLGNTDHTALVEKAMKFGDFNEDGQVNEITVKVAV